MDPATVPAPPPQARSLDAESGLAWLSRGWSLFMRAPGQWIVMVLAMLVVSIICNMVPVIGNLLSPFVGALMAGGVLHGARRLQIEGRMETADLFAMLSHRALGPLLIVAAIYLGLSIAATLVAVLAGIATGGMSLLTNAIESDPSALVAGGSMVIAVLIGALLLVIALSLLMAMYWFAIPLIVFDAVEPWRAMKTSLAACLANILPMLVYGVLLMVIFILGMIPLLLGLLIAIPVLMGSWLHSYQEIFGREIQNP
jgi:uncharacterized membrane protein